MPGHQLALHGLGSTGARAPRWSSGLSAPRRCRATALGREFPYELLAAVAQRNAAELDAALDQLVVAGLAFRRGTPPQATFLFKHALAPMARCCGSGRDGLCGRQTKKRIQN
jgi:hypothetical protein